MLESNLEQIFVVLNAILSLWSKYKFYAKLADPQGCEGKKKTGVTCSKQFISDLWLWSPSKRVEIILVSLIILTTCPILCRSPTQTALTDRGMDATRPVKVRCVLGVGLWGPDLFVHHMPQMPNGIEMCGAAKVKSILWARCVSLNHSTTVLYGRTHHPAETGHYQ